MRVRSLFSGVGGIDLGLERAGFEVISQCEKDEFRRKILARHWPEVELHDDVTQVSYERDSADLLCGGFPCQDLSVAGRRKGLEGARSGLFFEFARIANEAVPQGGWILIENVPGLLSSKGGRDFGVLLSTLADLGFHDIAWRVCDSRYFGVPQRRRRVFILARRASGQRAAKVLLEPEGDGGHPQEGRKKGSKRPLAVEGSAGGRSGAGVAEVGEGKASRGLNGQVGAMGDISPALTAGYGKNSGIQDGKNGPINVVVGMKGNQSHTLTSEGMDASEDGTGRGTPIIASALDRMRGGADDNDAQANHIFPVGLGKDIEVSGTLGKKGEGGGGLGLDREGAFVLEAEGFNWQSGGDVRLQVKDGESPTLQANQVPAIRIVVAPQMAATLSRGTAASPGVSVPGRRKEDDENLVGVFDPQNDKVVEDVGAITTGAKHHNRGFMVFGAWNMKVFEEGEAIGTLLGGSKGAQYSLNNMPLVAKCLTAHERWDYETEDFVVHAPNESHTLRDNPRNNSDPASEMKMHVMVKKPDKVFNPFRTSLGKGEGYVEGWKPDEIADAVTAMEPPKGRPVVVEAKSIRENQRGEVDETDQTYSICSAGGKPGQGYAAARVVTENLTGDPIGTLAGIDHGNHNRWFDIMMPAGLVRRLTPTECERLQGFPDGWTTLEGNSLAGEPSWYEVGVVRTEDGHAILVPRVSDTNYLDRLLASMLGGVEVDEPTPDGRRYAAMGDAVTVPVAHWIGRRLLEYGAD